MGVILAKLVQDKALESKVMPDGRRHWMIPYATSLAAFKQEAQDQIRDENESKAEDTVDTEVLARAPIVIDPPTHEYTDRTTAGGSRGLPGGILRGCWGGQPAEGDQKCPAQFTPG